MGIVMDENVAELLNEGTAHIFNVKWQAKLIVKPVLTLQSVWLFCMSIIVMLSVSMFTGPSVHLQHSSPTSSNTTTKCAN